MIPKGDGTNMGEKDKSKGIYIVSNYSLLLIVSM